MEKEKIGTVNWVFGVTVFQIIVVPIFTWLILRPGIKGFTDFLNLSKANEIGDAIGGITAPLIGIISASLLFWTVREQIAANRMQMAFNKENVLDKKKDNILNLLFRLSEEFNINQFGPKISVVEDGLSRIPPVDGSVHIDILTYIRQINYFAYSLSYLRMEIYQGDINTEELRKFYSFIYNAKFRRHFEQLNENIQWKYLGNRDYVNANVEVRDFHARLSHLCSLALER